MKLFLILILFWAQISNAGEAEKADPVAENVLDRVSSYTQVSPCSQFDKTEIQNPSVLRDLRRGMDAGILPRPLFSSAQ